MAAVLLMVGKQFEQPDVVQKLLDIDQHPCKPQYNYASEVIIDDSPLHLYEYTPSRWHDVGCMCVRVHEA